jgi:glycosyltransferase involved in cell wall biosynthesis
MITTFYPPYNFGGDGIFVRRLSNELAERGHTVDVIHCIDSYRLLAAREQRESYDHHPNVTAHGLESRVGPLSPLASQQTGFPFFKSARIRQILEKGFDVIHYHNISLLGPRVLQYGRAVKLYTMHEYWLVCPTHLLFKFNSSVCTRPSCFTCGLAYKRPPQWWRYTGLLGEAVKRVDAFIAPSRFGKEAHQRMRLDVPIVHLPNFAPFARDCEPLPVEAQQDPYFLFVGRLEKIKGLQTLIPVFRRYRKASLLVAGTGSYERQLRELAADSANIRFLGHVAETELQALYRRAAAVIVPSICFEMFPLVILEAFMQQAPVIVRDLGAMPEIVRESDGGLVYASEEELVAAIDRLATDPLYRREMGLRGHLAYRRNWTVEAHLKRYFALIREISVKKGGVINGSRPTIDESDSEASLREGKLDVEGLSQNR